jgi:hypothetical protein
LVIKIFCFDLDNTLCHTNGTDYANAKPIIKRIIKVNQLFDEGNIIKLLTARGSETGTDWSDTTLSQLDIWGVKYHELKFGKPSADYYIDDRGISDKDFDWNLN